MARTKARKGRLEGLSSVGMDEFSETAIKAHLEFLERIATALEAISTISLAIEGIKKKVEGIEHALRNQES